MRDIEVKAIRTEHIREMQHCIGLDYKRPRKGKYEAYRNYCAYNTNNYICDYLVDCGYMKLNVEHEPTMIPHDQYIYNLTREGMDFLGGIIDAKIIERKQEM